MRFDGGSCEEEMIGLFLRSEISSARWRPRLIEIINELKCPVSLLEEPDFTRSEHNQLRSRVLARFRGYGEDRALFAPYPAGVDWQWVVLDRGDLSRLKYMEYDYWDTLSNGSRRPVDAAHTIHSGIEVFGVSNQGFLACAEAVRSGVLLPEPILVAPDLNGDLVILEGHVRITAYALAGADVPQHIRALLGLSPGFASWL